jgi:3-deoxy-D-manno-octulosonic-acid transferase
MELLCYDAVLLAVSPLVAMWLSWRWLVRRKPLGCWRHRLGLVPRLGAPATGPDGRTSVERPLVIWVHAVSAGEVAAARPVVEALRAAFPVARIGMSTITLAGMTVAEKNCRGVDAFFYLPFDGLFCMARAFARIRPQLVVVTEKELWPNFLGLARLVGAKTLLVNGRVSDRTVRRAKWAPGFIRWLYRLPDLICVQSPQDASRLGALSMSPGRVLIGGNTKVDSMVNRDPVVEEELTRDLGVADGEPWLVAGSTHAGEDEVVIEAFRLILDRMPSTRLLLAPRHLERVPAVSALVAEQGFTAVRRTDDPSSPGAVVILDTMGELRASYSFATVGFVGGSLVPIGGHSLLEPTAAGRAVLFGPHTENCADVADLVLESRVGFRVTDARELAEQFLRIAGDRELQAGIARTAASLIAQQRGAAARCVEAARRLLTPQGSNDTT